MSAIRVHRVHLAKADLAELNEGKAITVRFYFRGERDDVIIAPPAKGAEAFRAQDFARRVRP